MAKEAKHQMSRMEIEPAENGGHVVTHYLKSTPKVGRGGDMSMAYHEPERHVFGPKDDKKLTAHISKHLGLGDAHEEEMESEE